MELDVLALVVLCPPRVDVKKTKLTDLWWIPEVLAGPVLIFALFSSNSGTPGGE